MFAHFLLRPLSLLGSLSLAAWRHGGCAGISVVVWAGNDVSDYHVHDL
jgi:hypothetical protein